MRLQHAADDLAEALIVLKALDLLDLAKGVEGSLIELIYLLDVGVLDDDVGKLLQISYSVGDSVVGSELVF